MDIVFDANFTLYAQGTHPDNTKRLFTVNASTGAATSVGTFSDPLIMGLWANSDDIIYATKYSNSGNLYTVNPASAALTLVGNAGDYGVRPHGGDQWIAYEGWSGPDPPTLTASDGADDSTSSSKSSDESSNAKLPSIDDAVTQKKITNFELIQSVKVNNKNISTIIIGTENKDEITGTLSGEIIASMSGRDNIRGGGGADGFLFQDRNHFGKKEQDTIVDFNPERGDSLLIDEDIFDLGSNHRLKKVKNMKKAKRKDNSKADFIYEEKRGYLWYNENGKEDGWGDGGVFVKLKGAPELGLSDFTIV